MSGDMNQHVATQSDSRAAFIMMRLRGLPVVRAVMARSTESGDAFAVYASACREMDLMATVHPAHALQRYLTTPDATQDKYLQAMSWLTKYGFFHRDGQKLIVQDPVEVLRQDQFFHSGLVEVTIDLLDNAEARAKIDQAERRLARRTQWRQEQTWGRPSRRRRK